MNAKTVLNVLGVACILACLVWMNSEALHRLVVSTLIDLPTAPAPPTAHVAYPLASMPPAFYVDLLTPERDDSVSVMPPSLRPSVGASSAGTSTSASSDYHTLTLDSSGRLWITMSEDR